MKKFRFFARFEKEEKWLEHMAEQGWMLSKKSLFYTFKRSVPKSQTIRMDYREMKSAKDFSDYCTLFEDSGWKHIAGTKYFGTQYFLKIKDTGTEDIFSDTLSRAGRYKRLSCAWLSSAIAFMPLLVVYGSETNLYTLSAPKEWYFTPGLWQLEGIRFWWAFLFETPFALLRGIGCLIPAASILICIGFAIKSHLLYRSKILA